MRRNTCPRRGSLRIVLRSLLRDRRGTTAAVFALALLPLMASVGVAVDSAFGFMVKNRLGKALDAAGLAAGKVVFSQNMKPDAQDYFAANYPQGYLDSTVTSLNIAVDQAREVITLSAEAKVPTNVMHLFGYPDLTVRARTVIRRSNRGAEVALVMDNTGSMRSGGKMTAMKAAASDLVNILYGNAAALPDLWVTLVPYAASVNVGAGRQGWLAAGDKVFAAPDPFAPSAWKGCVEARPGGGDETDDPPGQTPFTSFLYEADVDNVWPPVDERNAAQNNGTGPNLGCGPAITSLINEKAKILDAIDDMQPWHRGGTAGNLGLVWGWRALSPRWRGLWGGDTPNTMPLPYNEPLMDKVAVVLTDGQNQFYDWPNHAPNGGRGPGGSDDTADGRLADFGYGSLQAGRQELDRRFARICQAMKNRGIILYTLTFGSTPDNATQNLYRNCASQPANYFHSPNNQALSQAFQSIGQRLSNLRIVE